MELNTFKALENKKTELSHEEHEQLVNAVLEFGKLSSFYSEKQGKTVMYKEFMDTKVFLNLV